MHTAQIEELGKAVFSKKLKPAAVQDLGQHVQVWAAHLAGHHAHALHKYLTLDRMTFWNGEQEITLTPADLPAPGPHGLNVADMVRALWSRLPGKTADTRVILVTYGSAENYGVLDVHSLDPDITYHPAGGDAYSLKYLHGPKKNRIYNLEFQDLAVWFPDMPLAETLAALELDSSGNTARDVWTVLETLRGIVQDEFGVDVCKTRTPAATAAKIYTTQYLQTVPDGVGMLHKIRMQACLSYWGGRAEAFAQGRFDGEFALYDAVSLYPNAVMNLGTLPTARDWYVLTDWDIDRCHGGLCTVEFDYRVIDEETGEHFDMHDEVHPCLPVSLVDKTIYPLSGISHCTVHEARYAKQCGAKIRVLSGYAYDAGEGDSSLAHYSRELLTRKQAADDDGNQAARTVYKLLLNSLYGKFGQHRVGWDLNDMRAACRVLCLPNLAVLDNTPNWPQMAAEEGLDIEPDISVGSAWCPEWAALIQGYARYIESRAMRETVALVGTTDSVLIQGDMGPSFDIEGITFKRECTGSRAVIVRSRLYVLAARQGLGWHIEKAALHGCPKVQQAPEKVLFWRGEDSIKIETTRTRKLKEGLFSDMAVGARTGRGKRQIEVHDVSMHWDNKRHLMGDYSSPLEYVADADG